jgi:uncharacterized FlaG/YvyC family protein
VSACADNVVQFDRFQEMTAVSFTAPSYNLNQAPVASGARAGEGSGASAKSSSPAGEAAKSLVLQGSGAAGAKASVKVVSKAELATQVHDLQVKMDKLNPALAFVLDQTTGRALIQLTDRNTKEVIQQFPTAAAIQISKALDRFEKGQLINKTA